MSEFLSEKVLNFLEENRQYHYDMTLELAQVPAPSNKEEKRAAWVKNFFDSLGGTQSYIDDALNVVLPLNCEGCDEITVFMAHMDVVFPDETPLPLEVRDGKVFCPGICDDTANLTTLLLMAKYILENNLSARKGILLVANTGEEGLGNLKGVRALMDKFGSRVKEFITFDGPGTNIINRAVGSHRYQVEIDTEGGHSYSRFWNRNAIAYLASLIDTLYTMKVPTRGKTTYNVGIISGGTSVNTIAQHAEMLYEYRSDDREDLAEMEAHFKAALDFYRTKGIQVKCTLVGDRPCGAPVDEEKHNALIARADAALRTYRGVEPKLGAASTDCNIPLSMGIPSIMVP
ncbi:MAG: M20/M25/M40 family metallo-hydrolase, partial [Oscillospiraceae bacterium]|nr:M20/M25/M40 family metallo-hydrolase [Oscillospiraceae bacterium]